jgi:peroxiredoxin
MDKEPHPLIARLVGLSAPTVILPWTTYADSHDELGEAANMSLADLAERHTLVVYFTPGEDESDGPSADTMSRVYRANDHGITQLGAQTVGVSTQTALEQQQIAVTEEFPQWMLADDKLALADDLGLPTVEIDGRDEYEPMAIIIRDGCIAHVVYPIASPSGHIDGILRWLARRKRTKHAARQ